MDILLTAIALVALVGCFLAFTRSQRYADDAHAAYQRAEAVALKLRAERDRVTVLERDTEALRRELRKLGGKFYASIRDQVVPVDELLDEPVRPISPPGVVCENWLRAKLDGPMSPAASCECDYCTNARELRRAFRQTVVPKTAQGQAELAKLNQGKP